MKLLIFIFIVLINSHSFINSDTVTPAFIPITFDGVEANIGVKSLHLTSEWISREVFYDGYHTEEIEYRNAKYPGSYIAIRYSEGRIEQIYFYARYPEKAVPLTIQNTVSWQTKYYDCLSILGEPDEAYTPDEHYQVIEYNNQSTNITLAFTDGYLYSVMIRGEDP